MEFGHFVYLCFTMGVFPQSACLHTVAGGPVQVIHEL